MDFPLMSFAPPGTLPAWRALSEDEEREFDETVGPNLRVDITASKLLPIAEATLDVRRASDGVTTAPLNRVEFYYARFFKLDASVINVKWGDYAITPYALSRVESCFVSKRKTLLSRVPPLIAHRRRRPLGRLSSRRRRPLTWLSCYSRPPTPGS